MKQHNIKHKNANVTVYADTLSFWKLNATLLPTEAQAAQQLLAIPATSAEWKRFFSKTGYVMRSHRRKLSDKTGEQLFF